MDEDAVGEAIPVAAGGEPQRATWDDPRIPWAGKPRRVDILCWAGITLSGIFYWAMLPFRASLVGTHPVLLELLNGSTEAIVAAAAFARIGHGSLFVVLLAAIFGLVKFDPLYWWAGRLWGERIIALLPGRRNRGGRYMGHVQRHDQRSVPDAGERRGRDDRLGAPVQQLGHHRMGTDQRCPERQQRPVVDAAEHDAGPAQDVDPPRRSPGSGTARWSWCCWPPSPGL